MGRHRAALTRKFEHVYREGMGAWEGSKSQRTRRRQRQTAAASGLGGGTIAEVVVDDSHGDSRYLEVARRALADLTRLWRLTDTDADNGAVDGPVEITVALGDNRIAPHLSELPTPRDGES
jgi:hypothetical protein